ncbi:hypothetical protein ACLOJK_014419 [Asimina triloba]
MGKFVEQMLCLLTFGASADMQSVVGTEEDDPAETGKAHHGRQFMAFGSNRRMKRNFDSKHWRSMDFHTHSLRRKKRFLQDSFGNDKKSAQSEPWVITNTLAYLYGWYRIIKEIVAGEDLDGLTSVLTIDLEIVAGEDSRWRGSSLEAVDLERRLSPEGNTIDLERILSTEGETVDLERISSLAVVDLERISSLKVVDMEWKMQRREDATATGEFERVEKGRVEANGNGGGERELEREEEE